MKPVRPISQKYAKRGPVTMPVEPPFEALRTLAGKPLLLSAISEHWARFTYAELRKTLAERKKK